MNFDEVFPVEEHVLVDNRWTGVCSICGALVPLWGEPLDGSILRPQDRHIEFHTKMKVQGWDVIR